MDAALHFPRPGPPAGPLVLTGEHHPGAWRAADRGIAEVVEGMVGELVLAQIPPDVTASPCRNRVELHQGLSRLELVLLDNGSVGPGGCGISAQAGQPAVQSS